MVATALVYTREDIGMVVAVKRTSEELRPPASYHAMVVRGSASMDASEGESSNPTPVRYRAVERVSAKRG